MAQTPNLFLVDDEVDYQILVQHVFRLFLPHCTVQFFADGADLVGAITASTQVNISKPKVIALDVDMPRMNGFQTLTHLKQNDYWQNVPVVMMTNRRERDYHQESQRLGASAFVLKPVDLMEIKTIMTLLCEDPLDFSSLPRWP